MSKYADLALKSVSSRSGESGLVLGRIDDVQPNGLVSVTFGSSTGVPARVVSGVSSDCDSIDQLKGSDALLYLSGLDSSEVIVVGVVRDRLAVDRESDSNHSPAEFEKSLKIDGKSIAVEADSEIRLTCGKSSIVLQRDGKIIVRGDRITTRATRQNKIKGATVNIN